MYEKIENNDYSESEINQFDEYLSKFNNFKWIKVDTIYEGYFFDNTGDIVGIQYNMRSWTPNDSLAFYDQMYFESINMMIDVKGEFMALTAVNESQSENAFKNLLDYIEQQNGKAKVRSNDFFGSYNVYSWELEDRLLAIASKYDNKKNTLKLEIEIDENNGVKIDTTKNPTINTRLFILNNKFKQDSILKQLTSGDWLYFKRILSEE